MLKVNCWVRRRDPVHGLSPKHSRGRHRRRGHGDHLRSPTRSRRCRCLRYGRSCLRWSWRCRSRASSLRADRGPTTDRAPGPKCHGAGPAPVVGPAVVASAAVVSLASNAAWERSAPAERPCRTQTRPTCFRSFKAATLCSYSCRYITKRPIRERSHGRPAGG